MAENAPLFTSGRDALSVVAEPHGSWNWALVEPDPEKLPLAGGGAGSADEMKEFIANAKGKPLFCGLLRLNFGTGKMARIRYLFISAANENDDTVSGVQRSKAMSKLPLMKQALGKFVHFASAIEAKDPADLSLEKVLEVVGKKMVVDHHDEENGEFTAKGFWAASKAEQEARAQAAEAAKKAAEAKTVIPEEIPPECVPTPDLSPEEQLQADVKMLEELEATGEHHDEKIVIEEGIMENPNLLLPEDASAIPAEEEKKGVNVDEDPGVWSTDQTCSLGSIPEHRLDGKAVLLNKEIYASVRTAVNALNNGEVSGRRGRDFNVVYSSSRAEYYLLYRAGPEDEPLKYKATALATLGFAAAAATAAAGKNPVPAPKVAPVPVEAPEGMPEPPEIFHGLLLKQATNWFGEWQLRFFQLEEGKIMYWSDPQTRNAGDKANMEYNLMGARVGIIPESDSRFQLLLHGLKERPYLLMAEVSAFAVDADVGKYAHSRTEWVEALKLHATYSKNKIAFQRAQQQQNSSDKPEEEAPAS